MTIVKKDLNLETINIRTKLLLIQSELKAPKGQTNKFGGYKYRSCEDILEAVKPIANKYGTLITVTDEVNLIGDRFYVKATATIKDVVTFDSEEIFTTAYAREEETKKGMDASQITGAASSYARKYALNGLLLIDDTKDADTDEFAKNTQKEDKDIATDEMITEAQLKLFNIWGSNADTKNLICEELHINRFEELTKQRATEYINLVKTRQEARRNENRGITE